MTAYTGPMLGEDADTRTADALTVAFCGAFVSAVPRLAAQSPNYSPTMRMSGSYRRR